MMNQIEDGSFIIKLTGIEDAIFRPQKSINRPTTIKHILENPPSGSITVSKEEKPKIVLKIDLNQKPMQLAERIASFNPISIMNVSQVPSAFNPDYKKFAELFTRHLKETLINPGQKNIQTRDTKKAITQENIQSLGLVDIYMTTGLKEQLDKHLLDKKNEQSKLVDKPKMKESQNTQAINAIQVITAYRNFLEEMEQSYEFHTTIGQFRNISVLIEYLRFMGVELTKQDGTVLSDTYKTLLAEEEAQKNATATPKPPTFREKLERFFKRLFG